MKKIYLFIPVLALIYLIRKIPVNKVIHTDFYTECKKFREELTPQDIKDLENMIP